MAGLVPAIHALDTGKKVVDARHKAGHDVDKLEQANWKTLWGAFHSKGSTVVMAGLVPAIHVFDNHKKARHGCPRQARA